MSVWADDAKVAALKRLWTGGFSAEQIAVRLGGMTRSAVLGKIHRMGLPSRATTARKPMVRRRKIKADAPRRSESLVPLVDKRAPKPESAPYVPSTETAPAGSKTLQALGAHDCRWPIGEPGAPGFGFCGARKAQGSYCAAHAARAYAKG